MDWSSVTVPELWTAICEVELAAPRPWASEFFSKLGPPPRRWASRLKCNLYYYRTNYILLALLPLLACFLLNLRALLALGVLLAALLCTNDPMAQSVSDLVLKIIRKANPRLAMRLRARAASQPSGIVGKQSRSKVYIAGVPRVAVVAALLLLGLYLFVRSAAIRTILLAFLLGAGLPLLHGILRPPNLKVRLASARQEFQAVWRGYQADMHHDYTL